MVPWESNRLECYRRDEDMCDGEANGSFQNMWQACRGEQTEKLSDLQRRRDTKITQRAVTDFKAFRHAAIP